MFMSIDSLGILDVWSLTLYQNMGGQCSFYGNLLKIKNLETKRSVKLDTTLEKWEEK